jgi:hypothetical protein
MVAVQNKDEKTVTVAKAMAYEEPEYLAAQEEAHAAYAYRKMLGTVYDAAERKGQILSRELTRRVNRSSREGRDDRWNS